jgi:hypothetical protein
VKNYVVVFGIEMVLVSKPVIGIEVQLDVALLDFAGKSQRRAAEIRTAVTIVVARADDFDNLPFGGSQQCGRKTALQPELMQRLFGKINLSEHHTLPDKFAVNSS